MISYLKYVGADGSDRRIEVIIYIMEKKIFGGETMATKEIRKLAHQMLDELGEEELSEVIKTMRHMKKYHSGVTDEKGFTIEKPTRAELEAIKKAKKEFANGESYTHEDVFGEEDYV